MNLNDTVKLKDGRKGKVVEMLDDGVAVLLSRKKESNYKHHKTEYVVYVKERSDV